MNEGTLTLSFSEAVEPESFNVTEILLQNRIDFTSNETLEVRGGQVSTTDNNVVYIITLLNEDQNTLKQLLDLGTTRSNTFISFSSSLARDFNDNQIVMIPFTMALAADHGKRNIYV